MIRSHLLGRIFLELQHCDTDPQWVGFGSGIGQMSYCTCGWENLLFLDCFTCQYPAGFIASSFLPCKQLWRVILDCRYSSLSTLSLAFISPLPQPVRDPPVALLAVRTWWRSRRLTSCGPRTSWATTCSRWCAASTACSASPSASTRRPTSSRQSGSSGFTAREFSFSQINAWRTSVKNQHSLIGKNVDCCS